MGNYLNPGNSGFERIINGRYVDKTGLLSLLNQKIDTPQNLVCISRPRRFGKSYAAQMLCAYYDKTCDSSSLFKQFEIAKDETYQAYLNHYDVIYLDMTAVLEAAKNESVSDFIVRNITGELIKAYPGLEAQDAFFATLIEAAELAGNRFIMIIDEWDAPIREANTETEVIAYLKFLRSLFKNSAATARIFAAAYMTGILPIKKDGSQSAISDFQEYTMIKPKNLADMWDLRKRK